MRLILISFLLLISKVSCGEQIFFCHTKNNKIISVHEYHDRYTYEFGRIGKKELIFTNMKENVEFMSSEDNDYTGRYIGTSLTLKNKQYEYNVFFSADRTEESDSPKRYSSGVTVTKDSELIATVYCDLTKKHIADLVR